MKKLTLILILITSVISLQSAEKSSHIRAGVEIDALPYLTGGSYFSAWAGFKKFRLRGVVTHLKSPSFIVPDGYEDQITDAYTILVDYLPGSAHAEFGKWWIGTGLEYWKNSVVNSSDRARGKYNNLIFTVGGGYIWKIWKHLYLNPWVAMHLALTGTGEIQIGNNSFRPKNFLYEASVKIGWYF